MADRILFYCQHVLGVGHLVSRTAIVRELSRDSQFLVKLSSSHPGLGALDTRASSSAERWPTESATYIAMVGLVSRMRITRFEQGGFSQPGDAMTTTRAGVSSRWGTM